MSRKLRPRKLRPQTRKTQTLWVSRKLRPEKYNIFTPRECRKPTCLLFVDTVALRALIMKVIGCLENAQCRRLNRENFSKYKDRERLYSLLSRDTGPVFVQETITQHTSRMAFNDTTRCGYKLGLYDNEKETQHEC